MPNTKSAEKRVKIAQAKTLRNKRIKSSVKTIVKKFESAVNEGNLDNARELFPQAIKKIDMAKSKGVFHKNTATRHKSRLALILKAAEDNK